MFRVGFGLIVALPLLVFFALGAPLTWDIPKLQGLTFVVE